MTATENTPPMFVELPGDLAYNYPLNPSEVVEYGSYMGVDWVIAKSPIVGFNGYVRVPVGHQWAGKSFSGVDASGAVSSAYLYGGLTFSDGGRWFGFDTSHANDDWPAEFHWRGPWSPLAFDGAVKMWSLELVREAVLALALDAHQAS